MYVPICLHTDEHGNVSAISDTSRNVVADYDFDAFGNETVSTDTYYNPMRYCGEYSDVETGLIYLRARYYDPAIGRFISQDPIKDGTNWYVYCSNNPIAFVDPSGLEEEKTLEYILMDLTSNDTDAVHIEISDNQVTITAYLAISGEGADVECGSSGKTYRQLTVEGIESEWSGNYTVFNIDISVTVNVIDINQGEHILEEGQEYIDVIINDKVGRSYVTYGNWFFSSWSKSNPGKMVLYNHYPTKGSDRRTESDFIGLVGHEFGHILGIGDAYGEFGKRASAPIDIVPSNDKMRSNSGVVSNLDMQMVLLAFATNKFQEFPQQK